MARLARVRALDAPLVSDDCPILQARDVGDWADHLAVGMSEESRETFQRHERTGRPLGSEHFIERLGKTLGRDLTPKKPGSRPREEGS